MVKIKFSKFAIYAVCPPAQPMMLSEIRTAENSGGYGVML